MTAIFLQSILIGYSGAIMPGPLLTYTIEKSIKIGSKAGFMVSIGHALLELILVVILFLGVGKYLGTAPVQIFIGFTGGVVLLFLGFQMIKDAYFNKVTIELKESSENKNSNLYVAGAVISASNPYFIVWWTAVGLGLILNAYNMFGIMGVVLFYIGHIIADISWFGFISTLISKTRNFINLKVFKSVIIGLGIFLIVFGFGFISSSVKLLI